MSHMTESIRGVLQSAFATEQIPTDVQPNHILVRDSSRERISQIVSQSGFCPIIAECRSGKSWACTVVPFKTPSPFFDKDDLSALFSRCKYTGPIAPAGESSWEGVNETRGYTCGALSTCISEIVERYSQGDLPIVEIGSGIGYTLSPQVISKVFLTQPNPYECSLLVRDSKKEVYQMSVADLYSQLHLKEKRVPLFFALDVFDMMLSEQQAMGLSLISQLQSHGDRLIIMLDTNPEFTASIQEIESHYPNHTALPFFHSSRCAKIRFVLVPNHLLAASPLFSGHKPSVTEIVNMNDQDARALVQRKPCPRQEELRRLQKEHNLPIVVLEDFYKERTMEGLNKVGYDCKWYYKASFILDTPVWPFQDPTQGPFVYRSVTDNFIVKSWHPNNSEFSQWLSSKGIQPPQYCDEELSQIRAKGLKILGAEVLVIEATKR